MADGGDTEDVTELLITIPAGPNIMTMSRDLLSIAFDAASMVMHLPTSRNPVALHGLDTVAAGPSWASPHPKSLLATPTSVLAPPIDFLVP